MEPTVLTKVVLPLALFIIMLGMGLSLVIDDFKRVVQFPKAIATGLLCQMVMLPLIGFGIVSLIPMASPELAVGLVILTLCPGGTTSNLMTYLARGDVALSITLTAVVSLVTPFTIPIFADLAMNHLMGAGQAISLPMGKTIIALLAITVVPVAIGMGIRAKWPDLAAKADKPVKILSVVFLFAIIAAIVKKNIDELPTFIAQTGTATLLLNVVTMGLGFGIARIAGLNRAQQTTIGMEVGIQNGTTALLVTGTLLANSTMTIAPAIYSLLMFVTGGAFGYLANLGRSADDSAEPEEEPTA